MSWNFTLQNSLARNFVVNTAANVSTLRLTPSGQVTNLNGFGVVTTVKPEAATLTSAISASLCG